MKTIMLALSRWAKGHVWLSRLFVVMGNLALIGLACLVGEMTRSLNIAFQSFWLTGAIVCAGVLGICYPRPYLQKKNRGFYARQKRFDIGLLSIGFFAFIVESNRQFADVFPVQEIFAIHRTIDMRTIVLDSAASSQLASVKEFVESDEFQSFSKKEKKQYVKSQLKELRKTEPQNDGANGALILLGVLLGVVIIYAAAALSCSLACSGNGALAVLVLIGGVVGAIALVVAIARASKPSGNKVLEETT